MASFTIGSLMCQQTFNITAGGILNGALIGPRLSLGSITTGACSVMSTTTSVATTSMTSKEGIGLYLW